jgi:hypothetical protein
LLRPFLIGQSKRSPYNVYVRKLTVHVKTKSQILSEKREDCGVATDKNKEKDRP